MSWRTAALIEAARGEGTADLALVKAYQDCLGSTREAGQLVLTDLAVYCGLFQPALRGIPADEANYQNGLKAAFLHILQHLTLPEAELEALVEAARLEAASYEPPGS